MEEKLAWKYGGAKQKCETEWQWYGGYNGGNQDEQYRSHINVDYRCGEASEEHQLPRDRQRKFSYNADRGGNNQQVEMGEVMSDVDK